MDEVGHDERAEAAVLLGDVAEALGQITVDTHWRVALVHELARQSFDLGSQKFIIEVLELGFFLHLLFDESEVASHVGHYFVVDEVIGLFIDFVFDGHRIISELLEILQVCIAQLLDNLGDATLNVNRRENLARRSAFHLRLLNSRKFSLFTLQVAERIRMKAGRTQRDEIGIVARVSSNPCDSVVGRGDVVTGGRLEVLSATGAGARVLALF